MPPTEVNWDSGASCLLVPRWALQTPIILQTLRPMSFVGPAWDERWVGWAWGHVISRCPGFPPARPPAVLLSAIGRAAVGFGSSAVGDEAGKRQPSAGAELP